MVKRAVVVTLLLGLAYFAYSRISPPIDLPKASIEWVRSTGGVTQWSWNKNYSQGHAFEVYLNGLPVQDDDLKNLFPLRQINELNLDRTPINGSGLNSSFLEVWSLSLSDTSVDDEAILGSLPLDGVHQLDLSGTKISSKGLRHLLESPLPLLQELDISRTNISEQDLLIFGEFEDLALRKLCLNGLPFSDDHINTLAGMDQLKTLELNNTKLTAAGLDELRSKFRGTIKIDSEELPSTWKASRTATP